jgi:hypothetical protein
MNSLMYFKFEIPVGIQLKVEMGNLKSMFELRRSLLGWIDVLGDLSNPSLFHPIISGRNREIVVGEKEMEYEN